MDRAVKNCIPVRCVNPSDFSERPGRVRVRYEEEKAEAKSSKSVASTLFKKRPQSLTEEIPVEGKE